MFDAYEAHIDGMHAFLLKEKIQIFLILLSNVENASFTRLILYNLEIRHIVHLSSLLVSYCYIGIPVRH